MPRDSSGRAWSFMTRISAKRWRPGQALSGQEWIQQFSHSASWEWPSSWLKLGVDTVIHWTTRRIYVGRLQGMPFTCSLLHPARALALHRYAEISTRRRDAPSSFANICISAQYVKGPTAGCSVIMAAIKTAKRMQRQLIASRRSGKTPVLGTIYILITVY